MKKKLQKDILRVFASLVLFAFTAFSFPAVAAVSSHWEVSRSVTVLDTIPNTDSTSMDSVSFHLTGLSNLSSTFIAISKDSMKVASSSIYPALAIQQHLKGNLKGVYVQTISNEPGSQENMYIRGLSQPLLSHKSVFENQPAVYIDGIPMITDHPFVYDIQKYKFNPIGPATNLLAALDLDDIASIKVLKSPEALASLGPRAANGAIMITTKNAHAGDKKISINGYYGIVPALDAKPVNADYIAKVRQPLYNYYASAQNNSDYPEYLSNVADPNYYGPANWTDLYYKNAMVHNINGSLTGGTERANFRFFGGTSQGNNGVDGTKLNRYTAAFSINMLPLTWLTISTTVKATQLNRDRNKSLRDRLAEMDYIPDLTYPLAPNKSLYGVYLNQYNDALDKNTTNVIEGSFSLKATINNWGFSSQLAFDYNEGRRDLFWPSTLLEGNNYTSSYYGENRRLVLNNKISYSDTLEGGHIFSVVAGQSLQSDLHRYNYAYAYKGLSDYIKINVVNGNSGASDYLESKEYTGSYRFLDRLKEHTLSFFGHLQYAYKGLLSADAIVRSDASSFAQPTARWFVSPAFSVNWSLKNSFLVDNSTISNLDLKAAWGRVGRLFPNATLGSGPQYRVDLGWTGAPRMASYNGVATLTRPYSTGWVGYNIKWPYSETKSIDLSAGFFHNRLNADLIYYIKDDKRMVLGMPTLASSGYAKSFEQGLWVRNSGLEISIDGDIIRNRTSDLLWNVGVNAGLNQNRLIELPEGKKETIIGNQKLVVGQAIDRYWLLQTEGFYASDAEVPVNPTTHQPMDYEGISLKRGDARWKDVNGDYTIDNKDRILERHILPTIVGGLNTAFQWKAFSFSANFYFALGQSILNQNISNRLDFVNISAAKDINTALLKDVTFWQKTFDRADYPIYNPWSESKPYQVEQNLYLEDASFLKLKTVSLGYDLTKTDIFNRERPSFTKFLIYVAANNILTITPYPGQDPEIANYQGYYTGYGMPIMKSFTVGIKLDF